MDRLVTKFENILIVGCMLSALALGTAQVIFRYVFNTGVVWTEVALVTLTILGALVGASRAIAKGIHIRISILTDHLPPGARRWADVSAMVISLAYAAFVGYAALLYVQFLYMTKAVSIEAGIPAWIMFLIAPFCMLLFIYRYLQRLREAWRAEGEDAGDAVAPNVGQEDPR